MVFRTHRKQRRRTSRRKASEQVARKVRNNHRPHAIRGVHLTGDEPQHNHMLRKSTRKLIKADIKPLQRINNVSKPERKREVIVTINRQVGRTPKKPMVSKGFESPFKPSIRIDKKEICRERKERRQEIMKKTGGKGLSIKQANWTEISKLVRC